MTNNTELLPNCNFDKGFLWCVIKGSWAKDMQVLSVLFYYLLLDSCRQFQIIEIPQRYMVCVLFADVCYVCSYSLHPFWELAMSIRIHCMHLESSLCLSIPTVSSLRICCILVCSSRSSKTINVLKITPLVKNKGARVASGLGSVKDDWVTPPDSPSSCAECTEHTISRDSLPLAHVGEWRIKADGLLALLWDVFRPHTSSLSEAPDPTSRAAALGYHRPTVH